FHFQICHVKIQEAYIIVCVLLNKNIGILKRVSSVKPAQDLMILLEYSRVLLDHD
uniref:Uncharacterized protein n=1 Tax=Amphimedon queenslandica TaxID=400682 RepID=A0A1X7V9T1_AMPQE